MDVLTPPPTVQLDGLHVRYGRVHAVRGLTFSAAPGEVLGLVGGNGAGKSSTMKALAGTLPVTEGTLKIAGHDMATAAGSERARLVTGFCPDVGGLARQATIREHIGLALAFRSRLDLWPYALEITERLDLHRHLDRPTAGFSHGMSRRLSVLLASIVADKLLILDEPFDGVDPLGVETTLQLICTASEAGVTVLISTHLLELVVESATRVVVMARGRSIYEADSETLQGDLGRVRYRDLLAAAEREAVALEETAAAGDLRSAALSIR